MVFLKCSKNILKILAKTYKLNTTLQFLQYGGPNKNMMMLLEMQPNYINLMLQNRSNIYGDGEQTVFQMTV